MSTSIPTSLVPDVFECIRKRKYDENRWSCQERLFRRRPIWRNPILANNEVTFKTGILILFRRSIFGTFLKHFNEQQEQDKFLNDTKLGIFDFDLKSFSPKQLQQLEKVNLGVEDAYSLLVEAVKTCEVIDWTFLFKRIKCLRIPDLYINNLDNFARKFENLQVLVLCGNWIQDIEGKNLPRRLKFLELYGNQITSLKNFVEKVPKGLLYLGLGRNKLTDNSNMYLLANHRKFGELRCLDLSDNNIYDLVAAVQPLTRLGSLSCLQLEGNPCSVSECYKDTILKYHPNLTYLDNTQVLEGDKDVGKDPQIELAKAALVFTCHRIMGLPPPPKEKGVVQTIHIELVLPLLEEMVIEPEFTEDQENENGAQQERTYKGRSGKSKETKGKKEKKEKKGKGSKNKDKKSKSKKSKGKKESPYAAPDEYADEVKRRVKDTSFKTERLPWSKILQFPEEAIVVGHPENDLGTIRDTFRSIVNVKVVYLKIEVPSTQKGKKKDKGKKSKKEKTKKEKGKRASKKSDKSSKSDPSTVTTSEPFAEMTNPTEVILKKVTLANFFCELHNVNWSDKTIDFYWADHPKANPNAIPVEGNLRGLHYAGDKAGEKSLDEGGKKKVGMPNIFTCQVGFGVKRI